MEAGGKKRGEFFIAYGIGSMQGLLYISKFIYE